MTRLVDSHHVTIDLRGHTLSGSGTGYGVAADTTFDGVTFQLKNGQIENWFTGVTGNGDTTNVQLISNLVGIECNDATCHIDRTGFIGSRGIGLAVFEGEADVTRSTFEGNATGARIGSSGLLSITQSTFESNVVGVLGSFWPVSVSRSTFRTNETAILMEEACAVISRITFEDNGQNVVGSTC